MHMEENYIEKRHEHYKRELLKEINNLLTLAIEENSQIKEKEQFKNNKDFKNYSDFVQRYFSYIQDELGQYLALIEIEEKNKDLDELKENLGFAFLKSSSDMDFTQSTDWFCEKYGIKQKTIKQINAEEKIKNQLDKPAVGTSEINKVKEIMNEELIEF